MSCFSINHIKVLVSIALFLVLSGCQSAQTRESAIQKESTKDVITAVGSVTAALGGNVNDQNPQEILDAIQKDQESQSALRSVADAMDIKKSRINYCPVDGQRFSGDVLECPLHKRVLEELVD